MGIFVGGSGHGPESSCQISAYYKFFPGKSYFYRTIFTTQHLSQIFYKNWILKQEAIALE